MAATHSIRKDEQDPTTWRRRPLSRDRGPQQIGNNDVAALLDKERALDEIAGSVLDDIEDLAVAQEEAADALCDWDEHLAIWTLQLHADGVRSNENLRQAMAIGHPNAAGVPGRVLYRRMIQTRSVVDTLKKAMDAKGTVSSDYQTLIRGLRAATGLNP